MGYIHLDPAAVREKWAGVGRSVLPVVEGVQVGVNRSSSTVAKVVWAL